MRAPCLALLFIFAACGDNESIPGPFDGIPLDKTFTDASLSAPVHVARDTYGIAHISGDTTADVAFVQGYVMAHDRLAQMDILRRYGAGTLSELFGALDPSVIDTDLQMRVHRMKPLAQDTWNTLSASTDPDDIEITQLLQRFSDGVNAYATDLQAQKWDLDPQILVSFDPTRFTPWSPVDSLVLGRFQAFALSWSTPFEVDLTELYQDLRTHYDAATNADPDLFARRGLSRDLVITEPVAMTSTSDGFPNVDPDTGTRSDSGRPGRAKPHAAKATRRPPAPTTKSPRRPTVPSTLFDDARGFLATDIHDGPFGTLGPHAFMRPWAGSNNWAVAPALAGGKALLATDQHLQLPNPSIFYPTHIIVKGKTDILGVTFPGIPGVILGSNGNVAWAATVSEHDVNDVYLETIAPCTSGTGDCVTFNGAQVPLQTFTETIQIGALGTMTDSRTATYEVVPHHGPILPTIVNHQIVPRTASTAMSVQYTGYVPTFEIRALWNLGHATTVDDGFKALADFSYGSQNWTMIDNAGNIAWTSNAVIPNRAPAAYAWDPVTNPDGLAPFMVLPGDGTAEWNGRMDSRYVPHSINPAQGYLATANADPVGATFDNNPLNQTTTDGQPLYAGITYTAGLREDRITSSIVAAAGAGPITIDDMARIQHDTRSNVGAYMIAPIRTALAYVDDPTGAPADVAAFVAGLAPADKQTLDTAKQLLDNWSQATPAATESTATQSELADSAATALFNMWMHYFVEATLKDELDAVNFDVWRLDDNFIVRIIYRLLVNPEMFVQSATTNQPILCDNLGAAGPDDSCTMKIIEATTSAMTELASQMGTTDVTRWQWGKLHTLTIEPLFPNSALNLGPFAKAGDNFVVNRADPGWSDTDFSQAVDGPAQRFLAEAAPGQTISVKWALPGGTIYDSRDRHYRDLLDNYYLPATQFDAPYAVPEIVTAGESRWEFQP